jgi:hypothetical protein
MTAFQRIRITIDMNTVALAGDAPMTELAKTLRGLADRAEADGFLGWSEIEDANGSICGELQIQTIDEEKQ